MLPSVPPCHVQQVAMFNSELCSLFIEFLHVLPAFTCIPLVSFHLPVEGFKLLQVRMSVYDAL